MVRGPYNRERSSPYWQQLADAERSILRFAFAHGGEGGRITRSLSEGARALRITRQFLAHRLKVLGLEHLVDHKPPKPAEGAP